MVEGLVCWITNNKLNVPTIYYHAKILLLLLNEKNFTKIGHLQIAELILAGGIRKRKKRRATYTASCFFSDLIKSGILI